MGMKGRRSPLKSVRRICLVWPTRRLRMVCHDFWKWSRAQDVQDSIQAKPNAASEARSRLKAQEEKATIDLNTKAKECEEEDQAIREKLKEKGVSDEDALHHQLVVDHRLKTITEFEKILTSYTHAMDLIEQASSASTPK